ncbi:hypothetical protein C8Q77DRAFT_1124645 [Trametes polyzona]|nr:hypothetical protein C8Q77DRAFT_1124645 [Trametes polyzona]
MMRTVMMMSNARVFMAGTYPARGQPECGVVAGYIAEPVPPPCTYVLRRVQVRASICLARRPRTRDTTSWMEVRLPYGIAHRAPCASP